MAARAPRRGLQSGAEARRFRRELERANKRQLRAEHRARLQLQTELEQQAKDDRRVKLARARRTHEAEKQRTKHRGARRRARIRSTANRRIADARQARKDERQWWRDFRSSEKRQTRRKAKRRMSKREIDSLTEHNVSPELVDFFRIHKHRFPYNRAPDDRAVLFAEWVAESPEELQSWQLEQAAAQDWGAAELAHYADELADELAAVPF